MIALLSFCFTIGCTVGRYSKIRVLASEVSFYRWKGSFKRADADSAERYSVIGIYLSGEMIGGLDEVAIGIGPRRWSSHNSRVIGYEMVKAKEPASLNMFENRISYQSLRQKPLSREIDSSKTSITRRSLSKIGDTYSRWGRVNAEIQSITKIDEEALTSISVTALLNKKFFRCRYKISLRSLTNKVKELLVLRLMAHVTDDTDAGRYDEKFGPKLNGGTRLTHESMGYPPAIFVKADADGFGLTKPYKWAKIMYLDASGEQISRSPKYFREDALRRFLTG